MFNSIMNFFSNIFSQPKPIHYKVFGGLALSGLVLLFVPIKLVEKFQNVLGSYILIVTIISICFLLVFLIIDYIDYFNKSKISNLKFIMHENESWYHIAKQIDGRIATQVSINVNISNLAGRAIGIIKARIIRPKITKDVLSSQVLLPQKGSPYHSQDHKVPSNDTVKASVHIMVAEQLQANSKKLKVTVGITDEFGIEHKIKGSLKAI